MVVDIDSNLSTAATTSTCRSASLALNPESSVAAWGRVYFDSDAGQGMLMVRDLPSPPDGRTYQVWLSRDGNRVSFKWKDYRAEGRERHKIMTLATNEFIRRFLIHVLPTGFHRVRSYGLLANGARSENIARARELLNSPAPQNHADDAANADEPQTLSQPCPHCGGRMIIIETFEPGCSPRTHPIGSIRIDTS